MLCAICKVALAKFMLIEDRAGLAIYPADKSRVADGLLVCERCTLVRIITWMSEHKG